MQFELGEPARPSVLAWLGCRGGTLDDFACPSRISNVARVSTRQYPRLVDEWVTGIGPRRKVDGTHSLRRTKASIIYKQTGNLRAVQILLGHTKFESTVRYLAVDVEDALRLAEGSEIQQGELLDQVVGERPVSRPVSAPFGRFETEQRLRRNRACCPASAFSIDRPESGRTTYGQFTPPGKRAAASRPCEA